MRDDRLTEKLFSLLREYSQYSHVKVTARTLHGLLFLHDSYLYLERDIRAERLLAAAIYSIHRYNKETHYIEDAHRLQFYKSVYELALHYTLDSETDINIVIPSNLRTESLLSSQRVIQSILHRLKVEGMIRTKKEFCSDTGLNYNEIRKNRRNSTRDLLLLLSFCQNKSGWWLNFIDILTNQILDNLGQYFRSHHQVLCSISKDIFVSSPRT